MPIGPRWLEAPLIAYADAVWDPAVFVDTAGSPAAALAGTTDAVVKSSGLTVNAYKHRTIEFTSGPALGDRRSIRNNTATDIIPYSKFSATPGTGDSYRVYDSAVNFDMDAGLAGSDRGVVLASAQGLVQATRRIDRPGVIVFAGINLTTANAAQRDLTVDAPIVMYGVTQQSLRITLLQDARFGMDVTDGQLPQANIPAALLGAVSNTSWRGWGLVGSAAALNLAVRGGVATGYFGAAGIIGGAGREAGYVDWIGGSADALIAAGYDNWELGRRDDSTNVKLADATNVVISAQDNAVVRVGRCEFLASGPQDAIVSSDDAYVRVEGSQATGQAAVGATLRAKYGGKIALQDAPANIGRTPPDTDYDVGNGAPQDRSFFAAEGDHMSHSDGSVITRID